MISSNTKYTFIILILIAVVVSGAITGYELTAIESPGGQFGEFEEGSEIVNMAECVENGLQCVSNENSCIKDTDQGYGCNGVCCDSCSDIYPGYQCLDAFECDWSFLEKNEFEHCSDGNVCCPPAE